MSDMAFKLRILRSMLQSAYEEWRTSIWLRDPDSQWCCDGRECCCGAQTVREVWTWAERKEPRP